MPGLNDLAFVRHTLRKNILGILQGVLRPFRGGQRRSAKTSYSGEHYQSCFHVHSFSEQLKAEYATLAAQVDGVPNKTVSL
jgi:hypothetical protein